MFSLLQKPESDVIEVIVGPRARFSGDIECDTSVRIEGAFEGGKIETAANVILGQHSRVECNIIAKTVSVHGAYIGTLQADRVELLEGSQIYGEIYVNSFFMDQGVLLSAELHVQGEPMDHALLMPIKKSAFQPISEPTVALNSPATMTMMALQEEGDEAFELQEMTEEEMAMIIRPREKKESQEIGHSNKIAKRPVLLRYAQSGR